jgi:hypothetical protein
MSVKTSIEIFAAALGGALMVYVVPQNYVLPIVLVAFVCCITLGWIITFQNRAFNFRSSSLFGWPIRSFTIIKWSASVRAVGIFSAFAIGACLSMLWVANA